MGQRGRGEGPEQRVSRRIPCWCRWHIPSSSAQHHARVAETPFRRDRGLNMKLERRGHGMRTAQKATFTAPGL